MVKMFKKGGTKKRKKWENRGTWTSGEWGESTMVKRSTAKSGKGKEESPGGS